MNETTSTSLGTPSSVQLDYLADRTNFLFTFEVSGETSSKEDNTSNTVQSRCRGISNDTEKTNANGSD
tara:strand:+ start:331 stop:534 length:204 start_codon:yes stop_codon:yes gene_type:complete